MGSFLLLEDQDVTHSDTHDFNPTIGLAISRNSWFLERA